MKDFLGQDLNVGNVVIFNGGVRSGSSAAGVITRLGSSNNVQVVNQWGGTGGYVDVGNVTRIDALIETLSAEKRSEIAAIIEKARPYFNHEPVQKEVPKQRLYVVRLSRFIERSNNELTFWCFSTDKTTRHDIRVEARRMEELLKVKLGLDSAVYCDRSFFQYRSEWTGYTHYGRDTRTLFPSGYYLLGDGDPKPIQRKDEHLFADYIDAEVPLSLLESLCPRPERLTQHR